MAESKDEKDQKHDANKDAGKSAGAGKDDRKPSFTIRTPNPGFNGERLGVRFRDAVGETEDEEKAKEFFDLGYIVTDPNGRERWPETAEREVKRQEQLQREQQIQRARRQ